MPNCTARQTSFRQGGLAWVKSGVLTDADTVLSQLAEVMFKQAWSVAKLIHPEGDHQVSVGYSHMELYVVVVEMKKEMVQFAVDPTC